MTLEEVIKRFNAIFIDVLDDEALVLTAETTADDIDDWDSLTHIQLIVGIEKDFDVKFTSNEIEEYQNVGEMCEGVIKKLT